MGRRALRIAVSALVAAVIAALVYVCLIRPRVGKGPAASIASIVSGVPANVTVSDGIADFSALDAQEALDDAEGYVHDNEDIHAIMLDPQGWAGASLLALHDVCPDVTLMGTYRVGSLDIELDAAAVDASDATAEELEALAEIAPVMKNLKQVSAGSEEGHDKLASVSAIIQEVPGIEVDYDFEAFGKSFDVNTTELDFRGVPMDDQGAEVRDLLDLLPAVTHLDMDSCGVDDEHMASIRDDYPEVDVVWRIWFAGYTVRTDVERIFASNPGIGGYLTDENTRSLKYCTKVKYLDIGHAGTVPDISFVSYMPDLEVFICILDGISDITPLAKCTHLEFTELFSNSISDLTPLSGLKELRHLNLGYEPYLSDLTPIMDLELERLWLTPPNAIPFEQIEQYQARHPNCSVYYGPGDPHTGWRVGERYALLREQIGYDALEYSIAAYDPLYPYTEQTGDSSNDGTGV